MSTENDFDLEKLFLPAWAQESSSAKYAKYEGGEDRFERRGPRPGGGGGEGRRGPRRREGQGGPPNRQRQEGGARGDRFGGPRPGGRGRPGGGEGGRRQDFGDRRGRPSERREPVAPPPEISIGFVPDQKGVESLARQIRVTGRAYPLFDIAQMILQKPERHSVTFTVRKNAEGKVLQPLFVCALDDSVWLSEDEAIDHVLKRHFATFYQAERTATEPPKGTYTFVAQCGMSGIVLGPPNYHDYQNQLRKLHSERFSRMPFEAFKARVKIVRDEAVVKKWVEDQSFKTEYLCLNLPEPQKLPTMEAVEKHFRETHREAIIKQVEAHTLAGVNARNLRSSELMRALRGAWEDQKRFPLQIATVLSQQFAQEGLQFFKVNKTITHVSVARPHYLDLEATPVSDGVKRIVDYINSHPKCNRRQLVEALAPTPDPNQFTAAQPSAPPEPAPESAPGSEPTPANPAPAPVSANEPTAEQTAVISDLHWLIHQGHVIEFASGILETAKKPLPKPPKPQPAAVAPETATEEAVSEPGAAPSSQSSVAPVQPEPATTQIQESEQLGTPEFVRPADQRGAGENAGENSSPQGTDDPGKQNNVVADKNSPIVSPM